MTKAFFLMFAQYNAWANQRVLDAAATLSDEAFHRDVGAYFSSVCGTLNHLLVADRAWLARLSGEGEGPHSLDEQPYDDLSDLRAARQREDHRLRAFVERLDEGDLRALFRYRTLRQPLIVEQPLWEALAHVFNHQSHHRGEVRGMLTQLGGRVQPIDLMYFQRESRVNVA